MKKIIVFVIVMVLFAGCQSRQVENTGLLYPEYEEYIKNLSSQEIFNQTVDEFDVKVVMNVKNESDYRYDVIIDNPQIEMRDIKAVAQIPGLQGNSYPTIGILEDESFSLIPNVIDKDNNIYKGINLSGISPYKDITIYVYITFYSSTDNYNERIEKYMEVTSNAS